jgi:hypothetical protein
VKSLNLKLCLEILSSGGLLSGREVLWCKPDSGGDDTFLFTTWRQVIISKQVQMSKNINLGMVFQHLQ